MTMTRSAKLFTGLGLMAGLFWGCQDLVSQKDGSAKEPDSMASDGSALRLSIKDDSACREHWNVILDARTGGLADTAAEKSFLANCVNEIKPGKDKLPPVIPRHLQPDSISRCRWIVAQIEKGRNEMTVSYKRYCPGDCHNLEDKDSTRHVRFCRDPHGHGVDTTKPKPPMDSCRIYRERLAGLDSTSAQAASLRHYLFIRCGKPPIDTTKPPRPEDSCKMARDSIAHLDTGSVQYRILHTFLLQRCGKPPIDTTKPQPPVDSCKMARDSITRLDTVSVKYKILRDFLLQRCGKPPIDTVKPPVDSCRIYRARLAGLDSTSAQAASLRHYLFIRCGKPPIDTIRPPKDPMEDTCNMIRARLAGLDSASEEAAKWRRILLERCGKPPIDTIRPPIDTTRPPKDTIVKPPLPKDTLPKPPISECEAIMKKLMSVPVGGPDYMILKDMYNRVCTVPRDTMAIPPIHKDTLPKPIPVKPVGSCDTLRAMLLKLDPASAESKFWKDAILAYCREAKP